MEDVNRMMLVDRYACKIAGACGRGSNQGPHGSCSAVRQEDPSDNRDTFLRKLKTVKQAGSQEKVEGGTGRSRCIATVNHVSYYYW